MAGDASGESGGSRGADRGGAGEAGRPDDWYRIESERPERDAVRKAWDATHDPSPEFEHAARPLGDDYGRDRPQHRELTAEQRAELEETFERPADELLALREQDPRAGHNRDEAGRILDQDGNPRPERTSEQILGEAERQANLYGPDASTDATHPSQVGGAASEDDENESGSVEREFADDQKPISRPNLQAPSDLPGEPVREAGASDTNDGGAGEAGDESDGDTVGDRGQHDGGDDNGNGGGRDRTDQGYPDDEPDEEPKDGQPAETNLTNDEASDDETSGVDSDQRVLPPGLAERIETVAADLRTDSNLTHNEAADRVEQLRNAEQPAAPEDEPETNGTVPYDEPTTETVETRDGFTYERPDRREAPDLLESSRDNRLSTIMRTSTERGDDLIEASDKFYGNMVDSLRPAAVQPSSSWDAPQYAHIQGDTGQGAGSAIIVTLLLAAAAHGLKHRWDNRTRPQNQEDR